MALGHTHDKWTLTGLTPVAIAATLYNPWGVQGAIVLCLVYLFSGLLCGPDLDTRSIHYRRWGVLRHIWWLYKKRSQHRGLSHAPVVGSLIRIGNLGLFLLLPLTLLHLALSRWVGVDLVQGPAVMDFLIGVIEQIDSRQLYSLCVESPDQVRCMRSWQLMIGLAWLFGYFELGAASHYLIDLIYSFVKALQPKKKRRKRRG